MTTTIQQFEYIATYTIVYCTLTGVSGTVIPISSKVSDSSSNVYQLMETVEIPSDGELTGILFQAISTGPISSASNTVTTIVTTVSGWETATNPLSSLPGVDSVDSDLLQSVLWQYGQATNLLSLLNQKQEWYNVYLTQFWNDWYYNVFNLLTANNFGLAVWSIILNLQLYIDYIPESDTKPIWGFNAYNPDYPDLLNTYWNFYGPSGAGANFSTAGQIIILTTEEQRFILRLKYFQLSNLGDITDINNFLNYLCSTSNTGYTGTIYALDGFNMTMTYVFTSDDMSQGLYETLIEEDLLPRPAGVGIKYVVTDETIWGFAPYYQNFGNGNFVRDSF